MDLLDTTRRSAFAFVPERAIGSVAEHETLLELIESGRPAAEVEAFAPPTGCAPCATCSADLRRAQATKRGHDAVGHEGRMKFRSDPAAIRGSVAPVVTPFTADG